MRARLVHDVLRVVFPRVGLRRRLYEQGSQPESNEGLPQQCEAPPSAAPEVARVRHGCRGASSMQMGSAIRPRYRSAELEISTNCTGFLRADPKLGQEA